MQNALKIAIIGAVIGAAAFRIRDQLAADPESGEMEITPDLVDYTMQAADNATSYFEENDDMTAQQNLAAFLVAIRLGEGTSGSNGYTILCGGGTFSDWGTHPALAGWGGWRLPYQMAVNAGYPSGNAVSTAAGAYQITRPTWRGLVAKLGLSDFSPESQDAAAIELIRSKGVLGDVRAGRTQAAIARLGGVWASLPGAAAKQRQVTIAQFNNQYQQAGGVLA